MFKIEYEAEDKSRQLVWQISYGLTTRTIGVMIMVHGDDKVHILPWGTSDAVQSMGHLGLSDGVY